MKSILKKLLLMLAVGLPLWVLGRNLGDVTGIISRGNGIGVAAVFVGLVIYTIINASIWSEVLAGLGCRPGRVAATRAWIESEAMKWLPGGIWGYASRVVRAPTIGVTKSVAAASLVAELLLVIMAWGCLAAVGILADGVLRARMAGFWSAAVETAGTGGVLALVVVGGLAGVALLALPPVRRAILSRLTPLGRAQWRALPLMRAFASYLALCAFHAGLLALLVASLHPDPITWGEAAAADGCSWLIGFFAIGVPGGIGVREAGISWFLEPHLALSGAMAVAVLWRALQVAAELFALAASLAWGRLLRKRVGLDSSAASTYPAAP